MSTTRNVESITYQSKVQVRILVPANVNAKLNMLHVEFQEWVCNRFGGFSMNPTEVIHGAWRNPDTGKIECDRMQVYYVWLDPGTDGDINADCREIATKVMNLFGEKAVSVIRDTNAIPTIYS